MPEVPESKLEQITPEPAPAAPDASAKAEEREIEAKKKRIELAGKRQDVAARRKYARRIVYLIVCWLFGDFVLLLLQGFLSPSKVFQLSDAVLLAIIGGTTANVLGIFMVVVWYLFPKADKFSN